MENKFKEWLQQQPRTTEVDVETHAHYTSEEDGPIAALLIGVSALVLTLLVGILFILRG